MTTKGARPGSLRKKGLELDSPFDRLTALACTMFGTPSAMVSVIDGDRTLFRANVGFDQTEMDRDHSISGILVAMGPGGELVIEDALNHPRAKDHPMVTGRPGLRWFAGVTVCNKEGLAVGALGVMDTEVRSPPDATQMEFLRHLARLAGEVVDQAVAARLQAEQMETLRLAETLAGIGHWRWDVDTNAVTWSDEIYRIYGVNPATFNPNWESVIESCHPEDRATLQGLIEHSLLTGEGYDFRLRLVRTDGEERVSRAKAACDVDNQGRVTALFGVLQDITETERANDSVRRSEAQYRLLADRTTDIIAVYDLDGQFNYFSPAIESVLGFKPEEMIGKRAWDFIDSRDHDAIREAYRQYFLQGPAAPAPRISYRARHKNGSWVWLEAHPTVVWDDHGRPAEIQDAIRDISQRVALEAELTEARDRAETGARTKSEFLANMSHELRTPLTSVIGFSGLLEASANLPEAERMYANRIATASNALLGVINDILDYSKLEADAVDLDPQPFDPCAMAQGAAAILEAQCVARGLTLTVEVSADLPPAVMGDQGRLRQVTLNFLSNAVKFTSAGEIRLTVTEEAGRLKVAVSDTGIGIAPDKIGQLFDRFTQADASTTRVYGGTGLGLAISRRLIEMMGGQIGADSTPGEGSTFWFTIPMHRAEAGGVQDSPADMIIPTGLRVLMADDAAANRELVAAIMDGLGVNLDTVCDGAQAVEAARSGSYDLILMDVHMPVMDGLTATRMIRAMVGAAARTPIVALTANVQPEHVERCMAAGMDGHVGKPIQIAQLLDVMKRASQRGSREAESGSDEAAAA
ncbi:MAG: ATP-binding protein [Brevundimonas sp.]